MTGVLSGTISQFGEKVMGGMGEYFLVGLEKGTLPSNGHLFRAWGTYRATEMWVHS